MFKKRLLWQLFPSYLLIILLLLGSLTWFFTDTIKHFYVHEISSNLEVQTKFVIKEIKAFIDPLDKTKLDEFVKMFSEQSKTRVTVIFGDGKVIADSKENPLEMENHKDRPEFVDAINGKTGISKRFSHTLNKDMMYVANPVFKNGKPYAVIRISIPLTSIDKVLNHTYHEIMLGGLAIAVFAVIISLYLSRRIKKPLEILEHGARKFAKGDLSCRLPVHNTEEIGSLARTLNEMAAQLEEKINTIVEKNNEQETVFASMVEGVIAVDTDKRIIKMNKAAADLLEINPDDVKGLKLKGIAGKTDLNQFSKHSFKSYEPIEKEIELDNGNKFIQARSTVLNNNKGENLGAVVVLNDITKLRKLENIRRDFVANVSHELRTPITSIKGFVETLLDGAIEDKENAAHFLEIIKKHTYRLNAIIADHLSLSRIEQEAGSEEILKETVKLEDVINSVIQACEIKASAKNIKIKTNCTEDVQLEINPSLIEQAMVNLVDNALKYSPNNSVVEIDIIQDIFETSINVIDYGYGISEEHLPRLFERFYRVDKARSRTMGGTGLGLAIVKHIAQIHGGYVSVNSKLNRGSIFTINIPRKHRVTQI